MDTAVLAVIGLGALWGFWRGVLSQLMGLVGLVAAFLLAPQIGPLVAEALQNEVDLSLFLLEKLSILVVGVSIYVLARIAGYMGSKFLLKRIKPLWKVNRLGGLALGMAKMGLLVAIFFWFATLFPRGQVKSVFPQLVQSRSYQIAAAYNPMGDQRTREKLRDLRRILGDPRHRRFLQENPSLRKVLSEYDLEGALKNKRFLKAVQEGDYDQLRQNEKLERLMDDDELTALLGQLDVKRRK